MIEGRDCWQSPGGALLVTVSAHEGEQTFLILAYGFVSNEIRLRRVQLLPPRPLPHLITPLHVLERCHRLLSLGFHFLSILPTQIILIRENLVPIRAGGGRNGGDRAGRKSVSGLFSEILQQHGRMSAMRPLRKQGPWMPIDGVFSAHVRTAEEVSGLRQSSSFTTPAACRSVAATFLCNGLQKRGLQFQHFLLKMCPFKPNVISRTCCLLSSHRPTPYLRFL